MLVLVLGSTFPVLFVGWEGVGLCSYLLIGFWFRKKSAADATRAEEELRAGQIHHEHSMNQLRSQVAARLASRLTELLTTAREALELEDPRVHVAQEKLAIAAEELERQAEWLRSSA